MIKITATYPLSGTSKSTIVPMQTLRASCILGWPAITETIAPFAINCPTVDGTLIIEYAE